LSEWAKLLRFVVLGVAVFLTACGFRLQGVGDFPDSIANTYIDTDNRYSVFYRELRAALIQGDIHLTDSPMGADAVIRIRNDSSGQRVLTVSGRNVPTEYDVFYDLDYSVEINGIEELGMQYLSLNQAYTYDATTVLGKNRERDAIRDALASNLVRQVTRQLSLL
jgi:LPS-assembly lipoprotein